MDFMLKRLLEAYPSLSLKDNVRGFTPQQKLAVYRRDKGICQLRIRCKGEKVAWDDWHCDHRKAWSKGGKTTVENGAVACAACNLAKGGD
jgi:HNH endonuclease